MRTFRDTPIKKALVIQAKTYKSLQTEINRLLDRYNIIDLQYSSHYRGFGEDCFTALLLLGKENEEDD